MLSGTTKSDSLYRVGTQLPKVTAASVTIVSDTTVCRQAATRLVQEWGSGSTADPVWVIKVDTSRYIVYNGKQVSASRVVALVFDAAFTYLGSIVIF
jgi:hypothetical protein